MLRVLCVAAAAICLLGGFVVVAKGRQSDHHSGQIPIGVATSLADRSACYPVHLPVLPAQTQAYISTGEFALGHGLTEMDYWAADGSMIMVHEGDQAKPPLDWARSVATPGSWASS